MENLEHEELIEEEVPLTPPQFVIETVLDAEAQFEAASAVQSKGFRLVSYLCIGLCAAMMVAMLVLYILHRDSSNLFMAGLLLLTIAFLLYNKFSMPKKSMQRWESSLQRSYGTTALHLTTEFYELSMVQTLSEDANNIVDAGYSELLELKETENLLLLACGRRQWFFLSKKGFKTGTLEEFRSFITQRIGGK